jgi:hypothetical protein
VKVKKGGMSINLKMVGCLGFGEELKMAMGVYILFPNSKMVGKLSKL